MSSDPVLGDIDAPAHPNTLALERVVEKAFEACNAARPPDEPGMQADRQHLWRIKSRGVSLAIQRVECIAQVVEKLRAGIEPLHGRKAHVVAVERVGHHEVRYRAYVVAEMHRGPVRKVV